jgi:hypothetical protein
MHNDNEIIKALEQCKNVVMHDCKNCFYHKEYNAKCVVMLARDALDLINRQKAESEKLREAIISNNLTPTAYKVMQENDEKYIHIINRQKAEIERLQSELKTTRNYIHENNLEYNLLAYSKRGIE